MRPLIFAASLALAGTGAGAQTLRAPPPAASASSAVPGEPGPASRGRAGAGDARRAPRPDVLPPGPDNAAARRAADERQKRWDERMRRTTRSMCIGCG